MSKELPKEHGVNVNNHYHSKQIDVFSNMMIKTLGGEPITYKYYELVDNEGKIVQIVVTDRSAIVQSAAYRLGLDYRLVEFEETYEDLDTVKESKGV